MREWRGTFLARARMNRSTSWFNGKKQREAHTRSYLTRIIYSMKYDVPNLEGKESATTGTYVVHYFTYCTTGLVGKNSNTKKNNFDQKTGCRYHTPYLTATERSMATVFSLFHLPSLYIRDDLVGGKRIYILNEAVTILNFYFYTFETPLIPS
jgi:hypothetical protein